MPIFEGSGDGDLFVEYNVVLPVELSNDMRRSKSRVFRICSLYSCKLTLQPPIELAEAFHSSQRPGTDEL